METATRTAASMAGATSPLYHPTGTQQRARGRARHSQLAAWCRRQRCRRCRRHRHRRHYRRRRSWQREGASAETAIRTATSMAGATSPPLRPCGTTRARAGARPNHPTSRQSDCRTGRTWSSTTCPSARAPSSPRFSRSACPPARSQSSASLPARAPQASSAALS